MQILYSFSSMIFGVSERPVRGRGWMKSSEGSWAALDEE